MKNKNDTEIVWQSEGKSPVNGEPFMTVKKARDYFLYAQRAGTDSIAFILYDGYSEKLGLISESKPPMDEFSNEKVMGISAFGGSKDIDIPLIEICKQEVLEEAGYNVNLENIFSVGSTMVSSQMNQTCHLYMVDVTGLTPGLTETDIYNEEQEQKDPDEFKRNKVVWMTEKEVMEHGEWKSLYILSKILYGIGE